MARESTVPDAARGQRLPRMQRRAQLLEAAQVVFVDKGYHAAGMEDIAECARVSKPVLYQHFPGKLELYLALVDKHTASLVELVESALTSTENHKDRTFASIRVFFDFVARDDSAYRIVFESDLNEVAAVHERITWATDQCVEAISRRIMLDTQLPQPVAWLVAQGLVGMSQVSARAWLKDQTLPLDIAVEVIGRLAWRGVGGQPARPAAEDIPETPGEA